MAPTKKTLSAKTFKNSKTRQWAQLRRSQEALEVSNEKRRLTIARKQQQRDEASRASSYFHDDDIAMEDMDWENASDENDGAEEEEEEEEEEKQEEDDDDEEEIPETLIDGAQSSNSTSSSDVTEHMLRQDATQALPRTPNFNIVNEATSIYEECTSASYPDDDNMPLYPEDVGNRIGVFAIVPTRGQFARALYTMLYKKSICRKVQKEILTLLRAFIPCEVAFIPPAEGKVMRLPNNVMRKVEFGLSDYAKFAAPDYVTMDVCKRGCCVYVGDLSVRMECPHCSHYRYRPCRRCKKVEKCRHNPVKNRYAYATIRYRPMITILRKLLAQYPKFALLCQFVNKNLAEHDGEPSSNSKACALDFLNTNVAKKQLQSMQILYTQRMREGEIDPSCTSLNLLLGEFYDGAQVFRHKVAPFWPLMFQILSLPPNLRGKLGIGTFLSSIIAVDNKKRNYVEQFIYRDCLVPELEQLYKGIIVNDHAGNKVFLQARMVMHCLDTPALTKMLHVKGNGAKVGCPLCRSFKATYRTHSRKAAMYDHRVLLDYDHYLRACGQSGKCCPKDFYDIKEVPRDVGLEVALARSNYQAMRLTNIGGRNHSAFYDTWCLGEETVPMETVNNIKRLLSSMTPDYKCYNKCFDRQQFAALFGDYIYFPHANYRKKVDYQRVTNSQYLRDAVDYHKKVQSGDFKDDGTEHVNGVQRIWEFARLEYADFQRHNCWDPFHVLKGICENIIDNLSGSRWTSNVSKLCHNTYCHPSTWHQDQRDQHSKIVYRLKQEQRDRVDAFMSCLLLPVGGKKEYDILNPFKRSGVMKGHGKITLITALVEYMFLAVPEFAKEYKNGISLYGWNLSRLLSPVFKVSDLDDLFKDLLESTCIMEGLFPESEAMYPKHQALDLVGQIKEFGPLKCWWTLFGERSISALKKFLPQGGRNFSLSTFVQYAIYETSVTHEFYDMNATSRQLNIQLNNLMHAEGVNEEEAVIIDEDDFLSRDGETSTYIYDGFGTWFSAPETGQRLPFSELDMCKLLECLLLEIQRRTSSYLEALVRSPLFYLVEFYRSHIWSKKAAPNLYDFLEWIEDGATAWAANPENRIDTRDLTSISRCDILNIFFSEKRMFAACMGVAKSLQTLRVCMFKKAVILGTLFQSRGFECREFMSPRIQNRYGQEGYTEFPRNERNVLKNNWHLPEHYSSWCKLRTLPPPRNFFAMPMFDRTHGGYYKTETSINYTTLYAQLNTFFLVSMPQDPIVSEIALASVTCRTSKPFPDTLSISNICQIDLADEKSLNFKIHFVPITHIVPAVIGVAGIQKVEEQVMINQRTRAIKKTLRPINVLARVDNKAILDLCASNPGDVDCFTIINLGRQGADDLMDYFRRYKGYEHYKVDSAGEEYTSELSFAWMNYNSDEEENEEDPDCEFSKEAEADENLTRRTRSSLRETRK